MCEAINVKEGVSDSDASEFFDDNGGNNIDLIPISVPTDGPDVALEQRSSNVSFINSSTATTNSTQGNYSREAITNMLRAALEKNTKAALHSFE